MDICVTHIYHFRALSHVNMSICVHIYCTMVSVCVCMFSSRTFLSSIMLPLGHMFAHGCFYPCHICQHWHIYYMCGLSGITCWWGRVSSYMWHSWEKSNVRRKFLNVNVYVDICIHTWDISKHCYMSTWLMYLSTWHWLALMHVCLKALGQALYISVSHHVSVWHFWVHVYTYVSMYDIY